MIFTNRVTLIFSVSITVVCLTGSVLPFPETIVSRDASGSRNEKRLITVADAISMTKLGDPYYWLGASSHGRVAQFSPNGKKFIVLLRKGNIKQNTNQFSLCFWETEAALNGSAPQVLLTMSSSSNLEAIADVHWLPDNETITFLGENPQEARQIYRLNTRTHNLKKLTVHPTSVTAYSESKTGGTIAFIAQKSFESLWNEKARRHGIIVSKQLIYDLIVGRKGADYTGWDGELFCVDSTGERRMNLSGPVRMRFNRPYISPDGKHIVVATDVTEIPDSWKEYSQQYVQTSIKLYSNSPTSGMNRYELVETATGATRFLLDSPSLPGGVAWSPDSHSVVLSSVLLPLENTNADEKETRQTEFFAVEVDVASGNITKISEGTSTVLAWSERGNDVMFEQQAQDGENALVHFQRKAGTGRWERVNSPSPEEAQPEIVLEEDMNTRPKIYAVRPGTGQRVLLLDLNPQFDDLRFGKVESIRWKGSDGRDVKGGLYYPVDYMAGKKYPLVIQMHGWNPDKFWVDGPFTTSYAAQPLAAKGIMVLQADEGPVDLDHQAQEVKREIGALEGAVDYLDERGLIDRNHVGLIGFSRTCFFVKYALAFSKYHFAAASVTDGEDGGYLQFVTNTNFYVDSDSLYGGPPFGDGLKAWMERSPGFNVANNQTPLRITALNPRTLLVEWEWFAALNHLGKPVEMVYLQDGDHVLQKPWERVVSQQGTVDWFDFWLNAHEDPDPAKTEEFARWRKLRHLQQWRPENHSAGSQLEDYLN